MANGEMLRLARQWNGFQQKEAAKRLGIEQPLLSRVENGLAELREETLVRAEQVYELPQSFFSLTDQVLGAPVSVHPMWRRKADVTLRELDTVVAELNIRVMHLRRLLEGVELAHLNDVPRLDIDDYADAEQVAALVRAHWKVPSGPIKDLTALVERAGVLVSYSQLGGASISGVTLSAPGMPPLIVLNSDQPADRLRYTLAHELGHLVMHRFPSPAMEREAHEFAAALLMPANDIRPYFMGRRIDLALLAALKPEWKVAMQALLMRASSLSCLNKNQAQYLWKQINFRRLRLREPPELDFAPERPTVIAAMIKIHMTALGYSVNEIAQLLHIREADLRDMYPFDEPAPRRPRLTVMK
jgi:Zn-dependent peptidase ImmA (M78 family)/transcriptional regulator with XRE-family HTH domain